MEELSDVMRGHPELRGDARSYRWRSQLFREKLMQAARRFHLNLERHGLKCKFRIDDLAVFLDGRRLFWYDAEYADPIKVNLFFSNGEPRHQTLHCPIEKLEYFEKHEPSLYIRGDFGDVFIVRGIAILDAYRNGDIKHIPSKHGLNGQVIETRAFIDVGVQSAIKKGHLKVCPLDQWIKAAKEMYQLDMFLHGK